MIGKFKICIHLNRVIFDEITFIFVVLKKYIYIQYCVKMLITIM